MKKNLLCILLVLFVLLFTGCRNENEELEYSNLGFQLYSTSNTTYTALINNRYSYETIIIPAEYNGKIITAITGAKANYAEGSKIKRIYLPETITGIGDYAFYKCDNLTSITILGKVTSIGLSAFEGCSSLTSITIPDSVTSIGSSAFSGCSSLTSITIPDSVTSIGERAFYKCSSLTSITIPKTITSVRGIFADNDELSNISYNGSLNSWLYSDLNGSDFFNSYNYPKPISRHLYVKNENDKWIEVREVLVPIGITDIDSHKFFGFNWISGIYYYSEKKPNAGNYWHYVGEVPTKW